MVGSKSYKRVKNKLSRMGLNINPLAFIYLRLISSMILFVAVFFFCNLGYIMAPILTFIYYLLVEFVVLDLSIKNRILVLEDDSLEFFPVFLVLMKSGRNVRKALVLSSDVIDNELSLEFKKVLYDERIGKSLDEALMDMKNRMPSDLVANMIINVIEANRLGNNINDSINNQLSYIEDRRSRKIMTTYKTVPFRIAILSILFVFFIMFLLILCTM